MRKKNEIRTAPTRNCIFTVTHTKRSRAISYKVRKKKRFEQRIRLIEEFISRQREDV